ncbi:MAG: response regulator transcription factor [Bdellovibrionota bacterium]|nr:response regulator transcription factor [Bdellovibrionota bacterium]
MSDKKKLLIIEDNEAILKMLFLFLKDHYDVILAENGYVGIEKWKDGQPDLVILDLMLPDMWGYDICDVAKDDLELRNTPIVFLSSQGSDDARIKGYQCGAVNYLVKPIKKLELIAVIESTLSLLNNGNAKYNLVEVEDLKINVDSHEVFIKDDCVEMTPNEFKILYAFILKIEHVLSREKILEALGKNMSSINDRTIDSHISHLRKKINPSQLKIRSVYGEGYKLTLKKSAA